jgi:hypothetical protein
MVDYIIEFGEYETLVTFNGHNPTSVKFEGKNHQRQAMEFIRINMVHMGQIGE